MFRGDQGAGSACALLQLDSPALHLGSSVTVYPVSSVIDQPHFQIRSVLALPLLLHCMYVSVR